MRAINQPDPWAANPNGLRLAPFRGLRFDLDRVADPTAVTSPPYDMIGADEARALAESETHNVVRLIVPSENDAHPDGDGRYALAAETLRRWRSENVLRLDPRPALYVYEQGPVDGSAPQRGLVAAVGLPDVLPGPVLPHEDVAEPVVADRFGLMRATRANLEPILLSYDGGGAASELVDAVADTGRPLMTVTTTDGSCHSLWAITGPDEIGRVTDDLATRQALIADGHHRYAAYLRLRDAGVSNAGFGLALLVDSVRHPLQVRPIHRVLPTLPPERAIELAREHWRVTALPASAPEALAALAAISGDRTALIITDGKRYWLLTEPDNVVLDAVPRDRPPAWRHLDATVLHHGLIEAVWRLPDGPATVRFEHDTAAVPTRAATLGGTAVLLRPVAERIVRELAAAGVRMPRKSTSFGPKPATGVIMRDLDEC